jgi:hypothetical protein
MKRKTERMLTARTFAREKGISYTTVMAWLRSGLIPGAEQQETPMGMVWQIPQSSLDLVERQKPGPKPQTDGSDDQTESAEVEEAPAEKPAKKARKKGGDQ